jgi:hypothetical protein
MIFKLVIKTSLSENKELDEMIKNIKNARKIPQFDEFTRIHEMIDNTFALFIEEPIRISLRNFIRQVLWFIMERNIYYVQEDGGTLLTAIFEECQIFVRNYFTSWN